MPKSKLMEISYADRKEGIYLTNYADTIVLKDEPNNSKILAAIRFGGYVEQVRAMSYAIYCGGGIEVESPVKMRLNCLTKQYKESLRFLCLRLWQKRWRYS